MPDRVDTRVHPVEIRSRNPSGDLSIGQADRQELPPADHAVLLRGDPRESDPRVCAADCTVTVRLMPHTLRVPGGALRVGDLCEGFAG